MKRAEQRQDATERASASRRPAERRARRGAEDRGQALTEFVLVLPILLLVIFGILKFGALYNNYIQLTNAADTGARLFSIERGQSNPCTDVVSQVDAAAASLNNSNVVVTLSAYNSPTATSLSTYSSATGGTCPWSSPGTLVSGDSATLTVTYPYDLSFLGLNIVSSTMSVSSTASVT